MVAVEVAARRQGSTSATRVSMATTKRTHRYVNAVRLPRFGGMLPKSSLMERSLFIKRERLSSE